MTSIGLEPQWYNTQPIVFNTRSLTRCCKPTFALPCIINIRPVSNYKITYVGLEPQWYTVIVLTTRPLARSCKPIATYSSYILFSTLYD
jgi:hypothetical protein